MKDGGKELQEIIEKIRNILEDCQGSEKGNSRMTYSLENEI